MSRLKPGPISEARAGAKATTASFGCAQDRSFDCGGKCAAFAQDGSFGGWRGGRLCEERVRNPSHTTGFVVLRGALGRGRTQVSKARPGAPGNGKGNGKGNGNRRSFDCGGECAAFAQDDSFGGFRGRRSCCARYPTLSIKPKGWAPGFETGTLEQTTTRTSNDRNKQRQEQATTRTSNYRNKQLQEQATTRTSNDKNRQQRGQATTRTSNDKNRQQQEQSTARTINGKNKQRQEQATTKAKCGGFFAPLRMTSVSSYPDADGWRRRR